MQTLTDEAINVAPAANVIAKFTNYLQLQKLMTVHIVDVHLRSM